MLRRPSSLAFLVIATIGVGDVADAAEFPLPVYRLYADPDLTIPPITIRFDERNVELWLKVLARPDAEFRRLAADAFADAHRKGYPVAEAGRPELLKTLALPDLHPATRFAVADALITLDVREAAPELFRASRSGDISLKLRVEPVLADWSFEPIRETWLARLAEPATPRRELLLAIEGLGKARTAAALEPLLAMTVDPRRLSDIRLAAARGAGAISESGLEDLSRSLAPSPSAPVLDRLCAAALLHSHTSDAARVLLAELAVDPEPSVAADALDTLYRIDPPLVLPLAEGAMASKDANVRWQGQRAYVTLPTPERVLVLGKALDDVHPRNRVYVRDELFRLAGQPELDAAVREAAMTSLSGESWRGQEQAALLLTALDHKPAAPRLVALLESQRGEVMIATAWGLKQLALPETLPAMLDKATRQREKPRGGAAAGQQLGHLFEAMTLMNYKPAVPLMRLYVPKGSGAVIARVAAIWGLGHLLKDEPDEALAAQLMERVMDTGMPPEEVPVRQLSAVSIGRMKVRSQLPQLKELVGAERDHAPDDYAGAWAIHEISGETIPDAPLLEQLATGWFLEPTR